MSQRNKKEGVVRTETLFFALYEYRALTTSQVQRITGYGNRYIYNKLRQLRQDGYIVSSNIKGNYIAGQSRQGKYHRLSQKGIEYLKSLGMEIQLTADDLRVRNIRLPYLLIGNELSVELGHYGWTFKDSREAKKIENVNRGDVLHGTLTNPDKTKEYAMYVLLQSAQPEMLARLKREIKRIPYESVLVVTRGKQSFKTVVTSFTEKKDYLIKGKSVKILPFQFAKYYLRMSSDHTKNHETFLKRLGIELLSTSTDKVIFETNIDFDYLVRFKDEEMYLVDMLDNDLMKMLAVREYRLERYKQDGRKVLILTSEADFHKQFHESQLGDFYHFKYVSLNLNGITSLAESLPSENVFGEEMFEGGMNKA